MKQFCHYKFLIFLALLLPVSLQVGATSLSGRNEEYAGKRLNFYKYTDPVTLQKELAFTVDFDTEGNFETDVPLENAGYFFSDFGIYRGMLLLRPEDETVLRFPPLREKSFADEKNPYFEPVSFWFATESGNNLTDTIAAFEADLNQLVDKYFNYLYFRQSEEIFDSLKTTLNKKYPATDSEIIALHKHLKLGVVRAEAFRLNTSEIAKEIEEINSQFWTLPAFTGFLQKIFPDKLSFEAKAVNGNRIRRAVAQTDTGYMLEFVETQYKLSGAIAELVLIKMFYDGYYSNEFPGDAIIAMLQSIKNGAESEIALVAENVIRKLEFLKPGTAAPVVCLENTDNNEICTNEFPEKYKYLLFADTEMVVCQEHLKYLTEIQNQFQEQLQIIIVLRNTDQVGMNNFLEEQEIPGVKLVDKNGEYIDEYNIQSFPQAYLLDMDHSVVFEHTQNPLDGFEQQFVAFLQNRRIEELRNQSR